MPAVKMACPHCAKKFAFDDSKVGKTAKCPGCQQKITLVASAPSSTALTVGPKKSTAVVAKPKSKESDGPKPTLKKKDSTAPKRPTDTRLPPAGERPADQNEPEAPSLVTGLASKIDGKAILDGAGVAAKSTFSAVKFMAAAVMTKKEAPPPQTVDPRPRESEDVARIAPVPMKACPFCAEPIAAAAKKCKHCGEFLDGRKPAKQAAPTAPKVVNNTTVVHNTSIVQQSNTLVIGDTAPKWSKGTAAVLSFLIPGLGQMYKGQVINGLFWFCIVIAGYLLVIPGLILHFFCILGAASGDPRA